MNEEIELAAKTSGAIDDGHATTSGVTLTPLGKAFVDACSPPHGPGRAD
jgi:hypothetical protein